MLDDFNHHHHHAVFAGSCGRLSSTHRVALTATDTWQVFTPSQPLKPLNPHNPHNPYTLTTPCQPSRSHTTPHHPIHHPFTTPHRGSTSGPELSSRWQHRSLRPAGGRCAPRRSVCARRCPPAPPSTHPTPPHSTAPTPRPPPLTPCPPAPHPPLLNPPPPRGRCTRRWSLSGCGRGRRRAGRTRPPTLSTGGRGWRGCCVRGSGSRRAPQRTWRRLWRQRRRRPRAARSWCQTACAASIGSSRRLHPLRMLNPLACYTPLVRYTTLSGSSRP